MKTTTARKILRAVKRMQGFRMAAKKKKDLMNGIIIQEAEKSRNTFPRNRLKVLQVPNDVLTSVECQKRKKNWFHIVRTRP